MSGEALLPSAVVSAGLSRGSPVPLRADVSRLALHTGKAIEAAVAGTSVHSSVTGTSRKSIPARVSSRPIGTDEPNGARLALPAREAILARRPITASPPVETRVAKRSGGSGAPGVALDSGEAAGSG